MGRRGGRHVDGRAGRIVDVGSASSTVIHRISCWTWRRRRRSLRPGSSSTSSATMSRSSRRRTLRTIHCSWVVSCSARRPGRRTVDRAGAARGGPRSPASGARPCWSRRLGRDRRGHRAVGRGSPRPGGDDCHALLRLAAAGAAAMPRPVSMTSMRFCFRVAVAAHEGEVPGRRLPVDVANLVSRHVVTQVVVVEARPWKTDANSSSRLRERRRECTKSLLFTRVSSVVAMTCPALSGRADPAHHGVDDALDRQVVGDRFETQDDSVPQDPVHERLDVVGDDVVAPSMSAALGLRWRTRCSPGGWPRTGRTTPGPGRCSRRGAA